MNAVVELRGVSKRFGDFVALEETNFQILEGEFMTFLGPSGCGKTTCLRLISGLDTPTTGQVFLAGQNVTFDPPYKRNVNQVFQSYALFPHLTIWDNIAFGLRMKKLSSAEVTRRVDSVVQMTSLEAWVQRKPAQLSGGQRQRVALARAIVCEPKVLLLDEPLSALDAKLRQQMRNELKSLQRRLGMTFIFVTHDQEEALTLSDRIAVMNQGRVQQVGTVAEVYHHPATRFVATFIGEANLWEGRLVARRNGGTQCTLDSGLEISARDVPELTPGRVLISIRPEKIRVSRVKSEGDNVWQGTLVQRLFRGASDELIVKLEDGLEIHVLQTSEDPESSDVSEAEAVWLTVSSRDINLLKTESENCA